MKEAHSPSEESLEGTVGISMEIELGWAKHDKESIDHISHRRAKETELLKRLISLCDRLDIPISFNIVGHLLLEGCKGTHSSRPGAESWFGMDPGTSREIDPEFYAPDLIELVVEASVDHEICTHTFSHTPCGEVDSDTVDWELTEARRIHEASGISWSSAMVPPRHSRPDFQMLQRHGIDTLRVPYPKRTFDMSRPERLYYSFFAPHPTEGPHVVDGMCLTYSSPYLSLAAPHLPHGQLDPHPIFQTVPQNARKRWHKRYLKYALRSAIEEPTTAHFWSHLWDISNKVQWPLVKTFMKQLSSERDHGNVEFILLRDIRKRL
jgi:hypothetical protein